MGEISYYQTLNINPSATQAEIKYAYRQLVKQFHPDTQAAHASHDAIALINAAYEVLGDPQRRRDYDQSLSCELNHPAAQGQRSAHAHQQYYQYQHQRQTGKQFDIALENWVKHVFLPVNRLIHQILQPLNLELDNLSADPFDDELMEGFQAYLANSRLWQKKALHQFRSIPNPSSMAGVAANLYHCLHQISDGIDELERFTWNYDEAYLHTGQELFRIAVGLRQEAQVGISNFR